MTSPTIDVARIRTVIADFLLSDFDAAIQFAPVPDAFSRNPTKADAEKARDIKRAYRRRMAEDAADRLWAQLKPLVEP